MEAFNITHLFFQNAKTFPQKIAIIEGEKQVTFGELATQIDQTIAYFQSKGIQKGDRVLVFVPMSLDLYRIVLALFKMGATAVFLDEWINKKRLELCCEIADCKAIIGGWKVAALSLFSSTLRKIPIHLRVGYKIVPTKPILQTAKSDTALITFTTGSTGTPKAAKRTHGFLNEQFKALEKELNAHQNDVVLTSLPIVLLINLGIRCTSIVANFNPKKQQKLKTELIVSQLQKHSVSIIIGSPYFVQKLAIYCNTNRIELTHLKQLFTGGAPVFPREVKQYLEAFKHTSIKIVYGSTEAEPISTIDASTLLKFEDDSFKNGLNVGIPADVATVKIISISDEALSYASEEELNSCTLKENEIGEIIVSGSHVLDAYFNNQEALLRNKIFINGNCWHRTGDSGFLRDGYLFLTGRNSTLIHSEGKIVAPFIVENVLKNIEGIAMGTILQKDGKKYIVVELSKENADKTKLTNAIQALNLPFDEIKFMPQLPRDPRHFSKIDYDACKNLI